MTERDVPPPERPRKRRQEGEQEHLREDAGVEGGMLEEDERVVGSRKDVGRGEGAGSGRRKGLLERIRGKLTGR
jgi:hypothetical protein